MNMETLLIKQTYVLKIDNNYSKLRVGSYDTDIATDEKMDRSWKGLVSLLPVEGLFVKP